MNNPDSQEIVGRFFKALEILKINKVIRGTSTFANKYGINRMNLYQLSHNYASNIFQPCWLTYLSRDYGVSAYWLLTGKGDVMSK